MVKPNDSSIVINCLVKPCPILSLALKKNCNMTRLPIWGKKFGDKIKKYHVALFVHKLNVAVLIGVATRRGHTC